MKPFFTEADCSVTGYITLAKANRLLKKRAQVVYGVERGDRLWQFDTQLFTEADCDVIQRKPWTAVSGFAGTCTGVSEIFSISLDKANRLLSERGKVVTGSISNEPLGRGLHVTQPFGEVTGSQDTHRALLICVEEIEQDTAEKIVADLIERNGSHSISKLIERARKLLAKTTKE